MNGAALLATVLCFGAFALVAVAARSWVGAYVRIDSVDVVVFDEGVLETFSAILLVPKPAPFTALASPTMPRAPGLQ